MNLCIVHSSNQHSPCGGLDAFASTPSGQSFLHYFFIIEAMGSFTCFYCGCVKPHSFKDCIRFACSFSAHIRSEELQMVCMICGERKTLHSHSSLVTCMRITNSPCTLCNRIESSFCGESAGEEMRSGGRVHCTDVHTYTLPTQPPHKTLTSLAMPLPPYTL